MGKLHYIFLINKGVTMKIDDLIKSLNRAKEAYGNIEVKVIKNRERRDVTLFTWSLFTGGDIVTQILIGSDRDKNQDIK